MIGPTQVPRPSLNIHFQADQSIPDQSADPDTAEWFQHVITALPNARAVICRDSSPWNSSAGSLTWDCSDDDNASVIIKLGWSEKYNDEKNKDENPAPRFALAVAPFLN